MADDRRWEDPEAISEGGERVSHLVRDSVFDEHVSIYEFATPLCTGADVLDAGCGAGYGSRHLADHGARRVEAVDVSQNAVEFSRHHFRRPNLRFQAGDLAAPLDFGDATFDFVFSSNALEHVSGVAAFLREARRVLRPQGRMLVAVPPITSDLFLYLNLANRYHVNLWSPRQWQFALEQFFGHVQSYLHRREGTGFEFRPAGVDAMYPDHTITAIFVAGEPRAAGDVPARSAPQEFVDDSFTREPGEIDPALRKRLAPYFRRPSLPRRILAAVRRRLPTRARPSG